MRVISIPIPITICGVYLNKLKLDKPQTLTGLYFVSKFPHKRKFNPRWLLNKQAQDEKTNFHKMFCLANVVKI